MDNISRAVTFLFLAIGAGIFLLVLMIRLDVMSKTVEANVKKDTAEMDWQLYLYHQTAQNVLTQGGH